MRLSRCHPVSPALRCFQQEAVADEKWGLDVGFYFFFSLSISGECVFVVVFLIYLFIYLFLTEASEIPTIYSL